MPTDTEHLLYGLPAGETEEWREDLLTSSPTPEARDAIRERAARDGWHSFREATFTWGEMPDWRKTVNL